MQQGIHALLTLCARPRLPTDLLSEFARRAELVDSWDVALTAAERHGLAPLLYRHLQAAGAKLAPTVGQQLRGLYIRHRTANRVRLRALCEILDAFDAAGIQAWVLKGPALMSLVYADPALRPMSDLDLLVPRREAFRARQVLREIGFRAPGGEGRLSLDDHHHLPIATRLMDGVLVQVELHHNALSKDYNSSLELNEHRESPMAFESSGRSAWALGTHEMLWHLCQHLVGPLPRPLRLIWVADIAGYAEAFSEQLDWEQLSQRSPIVLNVLGLVQGVTHLPAAVSRHVPTRVVESLRATGQDVSVWEWPQTGTRRAGSSWRQLGRTLNPPTWWLKLRYEEPGGIQGPWMGRLRHLLVAGRAVRRRSRRALEGGSGL